MTFKGTLYPYQAESVDRMVDTGCMLLGLVMGAGKTVTTISAVETLLSRGDVDRCLVVVPASLKYQWFREITKFTDSRALVIDGTPKERERLWRSSISSHYVIVNPESLARDAPSLKGMKWDCIVVDESTMIKSRSAKRTRLIKKIGKAIPYRFALTGQPIENKPEELFSIMEFVDPDVLGRYDVFDRTFIVRDHWGKPIRYKNLKPLFATLSNHMIRKTREDIADQLPKIIHQTIPVPFDTRGAVLYNRISAALLGDISKAISMGGGGGFNLWQHYNDPAANEAQGQIMSKLTALRMLCDSPELLRRSAALYNDPTKPGQGSAYASLLLEEGALSAVMAQPKVDAVLEYITEVLAESPKNKVVIFSFFKENLRLLQEETRKLCGSVLFTGDMNAEEKDVAKQQFSTDEHVRLFLSSDAGGYGVDLPMANYLISMDLPWSSGKLEQREARIIRLSSQFDHVTIATFLMQGSIEERQFEMLQQKKLINEAWVDGKHHDVKGGFELTLSSLSSFLRDSKV
jgi:SNF2 family DNA or RNA helicase